jgi:hypothetical protein
MLHVTRHASPNAIGADALSAITRASPRDG